MAGALVVPQRLRPPGGLTLLKGVSVSSVFASFFFNAAAVFASQPVPTLPT
jgi:hypothetical protein